MIVVFRIIIHRLAGKDFCEVKMDTPRHPPRKTVFQVLWWIERLKLGELVVLDEIVFVRSFKHMYSLKIFCHKYFSTLHQG